MLQVLAYELDECLLRVAVEQISGHHGAPSRRTVRTRCFELDMPSGEARARLARARFAVSAALDRHVRR